MFFNDFIISEVPINLSQQISKNRAHHRKQLVIVDILRLLFREENLNICVPPF